MLDIKSCVGCKNIIWRACQDQIPFHFEYFIHHTFDFKSNLLKTAGILKTVENENENENLLIPAVKHDIYHRIKFKNKIDHRLT